MTPIQKVIYHASRTEFVRHFWAGSLTSLVDILILFLFTEIFGINYLWSNLVGASVAIVANYFLCIKFVFKDRRYNRVTFEFSLFVITCLVGISLSELLLWVLVEFGGIHYLVSKVVVTGALFVINFYLKKTLLFRP